MCGGLLLVRVVTRLVVVDVACFGHENTIFLCFPEKLTLTRSYLWFTTCHFNGQVPKLFVWSVKRQFNFTALFLDGRYQVPAVRLMTGHCG